MSVGSDCFVRKHRAPNGASRHCCRINDRHSQLVCKKAPSAKRRIKTNPQLLLRSPDWVRKHRAPKGALRLAVLVPKGLVGEVRKHRAPKGALRLSELDEHLDRVPVVRKRRAPKGALRLEDPVSQVRQERESQKAPSTKRRIKTCPPW